MATTTETITRTAGPYTWEAPAQVAYDIQHFGYGVWTVRESHSTVEQAKYRAAFRVRTSPHYTRENTRIRRRLF